MIENKNYEKVRDIVLGKLVEHTENRGYEELSKEIFGSENALSETETRKRMYGMLYLINILDTESDVDSNQTRILALSDFHYPFQKPKETFKNFRGKIDVLILNGDLVDMQSISRFSKTYRISPMSEIIGAREYFWDLIEYLKPKEIVVTYGNHELRFQNYLAKNIDSDLIELLPKTPLEMIFDNGIRRYDKQKCEEVFYEPISKIINDKKIINSHKWFYQYGKTIFAHPLAFRRSAMGTALRAIDWFNEQGYDYDCLVMAHTHRVGYYRKGNVYGYEQGCCCDTSQMSYTDGQLTDPQKEGFLYIVQDKDGSLIADKSKLVELN